MLISMCVSLKRAVADALDIEKSLRSWEFGDVTTLINAGASRENIMQAIKIWSAYRTDDLIVLSIAGHGAQEPETVKGSEPDGIENVFLLPGSRSPSRGSKHAYSEASSIILFDSSSRVCQGSFVADTCHAADLLRDRSRAEEMSFRQVPDIHFVGRYAETVTDARNR